MSRRMTNDRALVWLKELAERKLPRTSSTYQRDVGGLDPYGPTMVTESESELDEEAAAAWVLELGQAFALCFPPGFDLRRRWESIVKQADGQPWMLSNESVVTAARAAAKTAVALLEGGHLRALADGVRAETVGELLDQAEQLVDDGEPVPAAVLAGGALETHLRHLCDRAGVLGTLVGSGSIEKYKGLLDVARKNGDEVITKGDGKLVTAWGDDRNIAAHHPTKFGKGGPEVRLMVDGIRQFVARTE